MWCFYKNIFKKYWLAIRHLCTNIFQTGYDDRDRYSLHFDISLDDLDFIQGHLNEKPKTLVIIFSKWGRNSSVGSVWAQCPV